MNTNIQEQENSIKTSTHGKVALILTPLISEIFHGGNSSSENIHKEMDKALDSLANLVTQARQQGAEEERRKMEPDVKLAEFLRAEGKENLALWIETKDDNYLERALGLPTGSFNKFTLTNNKE